MAFLDEKRLPLDIVATVSSTQGYTIAYNNYAHVYMWVPAADLTLNCGVYGTSIQPVPAQVWHNVGFAEGTVITAPTVTVGTVNIVFRCTDEELP